MTHAEAFADVVQNPGDAVVVGSTSKDEEVDTAAPPSEGMNTITSYDEYVVKDVDVKSVPSSGGDDEDEVCKFRRGVCLRHGMKGERYVQTMKNWKDRGGGRGYAFVTSKRVRYRCSGKSELPRSSSPLLSEVEGAVTNGDD